ncbi:testis-specific protein TEX28 [Rhynchocyon petersi]
MENQSTTLPSKVPSCKTLSSNKEDPSDHPVLSNRKLVPNLQDAIKHRILYLSEQLRVEKASRDQNTIGYLKLVSKADQHQAAQIRQAFEKVNQRTSAAIAQTERKLRQCHQQLQELEEGCRPQGLVLSVESSLDSCDQLSQRAPSLKTPMSGEKDNMATGHCDVTRLPTLGKFSTTKLAVQPHDLFVQRVKHQLTAIKKQHLDLQVSCAALKAKYQSDLQLSLEALRERKYRHELMNNQVDNYLQGNLSEIYQLKQNLACTEEKMAYLSYVKAKEIWEVMDIFESRITNLETLQRVTQLEMRERLRSRPQQFPLKFISLILTLATVLLVFISTMFTCPWPFVNTCLRTCTSLVLIGLGVLAWQKRHAMATTEWQAWVTSKWKLYVKDFKPLPEGT